VRFSIELKKHFNIKISQIELLGSATIGLLNEQLRKVGMTSANSGEEDDDGTVKYGAPLTAILDERLAYGEAYTTDATSHQYRLWRAQVRCFPRLFPVNSNIQIIQAEFNNPGERTANQHETTVWGTHEGFFLVITFVKPLDIDGMRCAIDEVVQRHGALRTSFSLSEEGKLKQTIHPTMEFETEVVDLSS